MKLFLFLFIVLVPVALPYRSHAQAQEAEMLALDIEKLSQMKQTLQNMYNAYTTLENGYNKVKDVTSGNYSLHQAFLDGLLAVSPTVKNYVHVADIISDEAKILSEYKAALARFKSSGLLTSMELSYASGFFTKIEDGSLTNIDALTMVLTAGQARMSDDERLSEIDRIYADMEKKVAALRSFNRRTNGILTQRQSLQSDHATLKTITGTN